MKTNNLGRAASRFHGRRTVLWVVLGILLTALLAPLPGYWLSGTVVAQTGTVQGTNERADFWREVRRGTSGYSAVTGQESNVLIQNGGENWRTLRNGPVTLYGTWILGGFLAVIAVYYLFKGQVRIANGRTGQTLPRWDLFDRVVHWYITVLFLILGITGLSLFYGRTVLIPVFGKDGFAAYAALAKDVHNYLGPFFAAGLVVAILKWLRVNLFRREDLTWFAKGGGMLTSEHVPAGKLNGGEKTLFWLVAVLGAALAITGLILNFPNFGQTRETMQLAHLVHLTTAIFLTAIIFGHIYMATLGTEGALEGMIKGRVDVAWARQHHDLWYQELLSQGVELEPVQEGSGKGDEYAQPKSA
jgi:formate dehydrogenase subunit gamma